MKQAFLENDLKYATTFDPNECLKQIELPITLEYEHGTYFSVTILFMNHDVV